MNKFLASVLTKGRAARLHARDLKILGPGHYSMIISEEGWPYRDYQVEVKASKVHIPKTQEEEDAEVDRRLEINEAVNEMLEEMELYEDR
jgi:hypothetical protein